MTINDDETLPGTQPALPPTVKLDKDEITRQLLDKVLFKLTEVGESQTETTKSVSALGGEVRAIGSKVDTVASEVGAVKAEQVEFREWKGAVEERFKTHSMGARVLSVSNIDQDVKLQELENRLAVQAKSSMRELIAEMSAAATVVAKTPLGQRVMKAGGYLLLAVLTLAALYVSAMTARLSGQPTTVVQQVAPTIIYAEGGAP